MTLRFALPVVFLAACTQELATPPDLPVDEPIATVAPEDPERPVDPDDSPVPGAGVAVLRLVTAGEARVDEVVYVHDNDGALLATLTTDEDGVAVIEEIPPEGVGVTIDGAVFGSSGLTTIFGIHAGDDRTFGSAVLRSLRVEYAIPAGFVPGVQEYEIRAACGRAWADEPEATGWFGAAHRCTDRGLATAVVIARGSGRTPLAWARLEELEIQAGESTDIVEADFGAVGWSLDFEQVGVTVASSMPGEVDVEIAVPHGRDPQTVGSDLVTVSGCSSSQVVVPTLPGATQGEATLTRVEHEAWGARAWIRRVRGELSGPWLGVGGAAPSWLLHATTDPRGLRFESSGAWICDDASEPEISVLHVTMENDGSSGRWRIVRRGGLAGLFTLPQIPGIAVSATSNDLFALETSRTDRTYDALLDELDPVHEALAPRLDPGASACSRVLTTRSSRR